MLYCSTLFQEKYILKKTLVDLRERELKLKEQENREIMELLNKDKARPSQTVDSNGVITLE